MSVESIDVQVPDQATPAKALQKNLLWRNQILYTRKSLCARADSEVL